jgi:hypothetical protein
MAHCRNCGALSNEPAATCQACGVRDHENHWAPPGARPASDEREPAPFGYSASGRPRRISLLAKLALTLAALLPPVGLVLGIAATIASRRHGNRPGNRAVAISSIFTALHIGLIWGWVAFVVALELQEDPFETNDPLAAYSDPFAAPAPPSRDTDPVNAEPTAELRRVLEQIMQADPGAEPPASPR